MKIYDEGTKYERVEWEFSDLVGKTMKSVNVDYDGRDNRINFITDADEQFSLFHVQDCCESVVIDSITGDIEDLVGVPILVAEERCSEEDPPEVVQRRLNEKKRWEEEHPGETYWWYTEESQTWTFYTIRTIKGSVDIRWHGSSNGYYSERVDFAKM